MHHKICVSTAHPRIRRTFLSTLVLPIAFAVIAPLALAQQATSVSGRITDRETGQPLAGAHISLPGSLTGAVSRSDGSFRLSLTPGRHALLVSFVGYAPRRDTIDVATGETVARDYSLDRAISQLDAAIVIGTRAHDRTVLNSPVPVDVLTPTEIRQTGQVETSQIIQALAPSFNFPRPTIADGTDHVRPSTLRGLGPDQVLVLVNGKRRYTSALVNVNGTIGRGSTGVDLNAIPASSIERIEILRDGAAAQYGSDAIAGVINIILKSDESTDAEYEVGSNYTTFKRLGNQKLTDGDVSAVSANAGKLFGDGGFLHLTGQYENRGSTNRSLPDPRQQYFNGDPRNTDPALNNRIDFRQGDAHVNDAGFFFNGALPGLSNGAQVYAFGGLGRRNGQGAGNWRTAANNNTVRAIYPNGFLPLINSKIGDYSGTLGVKGDVLGWGYDLSSGYGHNRFDFNITNSENATLGAASPTSFYSGSLKLGELVGNLDFVRAFPVNMLAAPLNVALGLEARRDSYGIIAGEPDSYRDGGVKILDGPNAGGQPAPGAQVFPGFQPTDAGDHSRTNYAGYVDFESSPFSRFLLGLAGRTEHYSDFGWTTIGKVSGRLELLPGYAIRGAFNTGFRAPSLGQEFFSSTATNFININGVLTATEVRSLPVSSGAAIALGAQPLKPERSQNSSLGLALQPLSSLSLTADYYHIVIKDRIVLSGNFLGQSLTDTLAAHGFPNVGSARYFTNAIDTRTNGIDIIGRYLLNWGARGITGFTSGFNRTGTVVSRVDPTPTALQNQGNVLFDRFERSKIEEAQPHRTFNFTLDHTINRFSATVHTTRYGQIWTRGPSNPALDQRYKARWITDANVVLPLLRRTAITLGVNNIADVYPTENIPANNNFGILPYTGFSPFGFNGRFIYTRFRWER
ncbi:MAG: TonB-dependent receptor domain-containing protein [Gemmatimonadaceae bacterium]